MMDEINNEFPENHIADFTKPLIVILIENYHTIYIRVTIHIITFSLRPTMVETGTMMQV